MKLKLYAAVKYTGSMLIFLLLATSHLLATGGPGGPFKKVPNHDIGVGPALGYVWGDSEKGYAVNLDISYTHWVFTPSINLKLLKVDDTLSYGPQVEFTIWTLFNWGGGVGYLKGNSSGRFYHIFIGYPMTDPWMFEDKVYNSIYLEPYYRLNFIDGKKYHELGIMCKFSTFNAGRY